MEYFFSKGYPLRLIECLKHLYSNPDSDKVRIEQTGQFILNHRKENCILFLYESKGRKVSVTTKRHAEEGYKVFVFRVKPEQKPSFFGVTLTILSIWKSVIKKIEQIDEPFLFTITYGQSKLNAMKFKKSN